MQQMIGVELLTAKSLRINQFDSISDSPGYDDLHIELLLESNFLAESPIVGVISTDDTDGRSKTSEERDDDDFEFTFEGIGRNTSWFPSEEIFPIFDRRLLLETEARRVHTDQLQTDRSSFAIREKSISPTWSRTRRWGVSLREILFRLSDGTSGKGSFVRFASRRLTSSGRDTAEEEIVRVKKMSATGGGAKRKTSYMKAILGLGFYRS